MAEIIKSTKKKPKLSVILTLLAWLAMLLFTFHACTHMVAAGDTWVAMSCGRHFINHGVDTVEPFSANSHHAGPTEKEVKQWPSWAKSITNIVGLDTVKKWHPTGWINQNWLTHVTFYWLTHKSPVADAQNFSFNTLVYWKFALYICAFLAIYFTSRILGAHQLLAAAFTCFALFAGRSFIDIRPAAYSNLFGALFLLILVLTTYKNHLFIWLLVPLGVFWANVHGGYIYLFIMFVPFFILHLLQILSKRWKIPLFSILSWIAFFLLAWKFSTGNKLLNLQLHNWLWVLLVLFSAGSIATALTKNAKTNDLSILYVYHIFAWLVMFFIFFTRFFPAVAPQLELRKDISQYLNNSRITFIGLFLGAVVVGIILTFLKDKLVLLKQKHLIHTFAAGITTFLAVVIFNPFHLTNLTHTFIISISEYAKKWRIVNEWHPAFEWTNPVGTGFPFLVMLVLIICTGLLWLYSRYLKPKTLKAPANEMQTQQNKFHLLIKFFGWLAASFAVWITFISFSFVKADFAGFILCTAFAGIILISILKNIHFIYLLGLLTIITLALTGSGTKGYAGRYIFPFLLIPAYVTTYIFTSIFSKNIKAKTKDIIFPIITAVVTIILMSIIFNPLKIKTPQSDGITLDWFGGLFKNIWNVTRTWHPIYEMNLQLTYKNLFSWLYIINIFSIITWLILPTLRVYFKKLSDRVKTENQQPQTNTFNLPKLDFPYFIIALLTTYMAYRSRRFIPIAAFAACPLIALFITQIARTINASINFHTKKSLLVSPMPYTLKLFVAVIAAVVVIPLGVFWALKFKAVYLEPWPTDNEFTSVFMRMTASDRKPFHTGEFIKQNKLKGNMFNYWTEGGFIAYAQEPDPNTGKTPLQLFMDGRAQAAYNYPVYIMWSQIMAGGPTAYQARLRGQKLTQDDYIKMGKYISKRIRKKDVWLVLMPVNDNTEDFRKAVETNNEWPIVFFNDKQRMYVDRKSDKGQKLLAGALTGTIKYPNEFTKNLFLARTYLMQNTLASKTKGLEYAKKALSLKPCDVAVQQFLYALPFEKTRTQAKTILENHLNTFQENKDKYANQDGYYNRLTAVGLACTILQRIALQNNDKKSANNYKNEKRNIRAEIPKAFKDKRW